MSVLLNKENITLTEIQIQAAKALLIGDVTTIRYDQYGLTVMFRHHPNTWKWNERSLKWVELF